MVEEGVVDLTARRDLLRVPLPWAGTSYNLDGGKVH